MWQFASETGERTFLNQLTPAKPKADQYIDRIRKKKNYYEKFNCLLTSLVSLSHFFYTCDHAKATTPQDATDRKIVSLKSLHANCSKNSRTHHGLRKKRYSPKWIASKQIFLNLMMEKHFISVCCQSQTCELVMQVYSEQFQYCR